MHDEVQRRRREIDELSAAHAAVERQPLERGHRRVKRLEHGDRSHAHSRHHPAAEAGIERPAERFDFGQFRHRG